MHDAFAEYMRDVETGTYPAERHVVNAAEAELAAFRERLSLAP